MFVLLHQIPEESDEKQFAFGEKIEKILIILQILSKKNYILINPLPVPG